MEDLAALQALYDRKMRIELILPDDPKEILGADFPEIVRFRRPPPRRSLVLYAHLTPAAADAAIAAQVAALTAQGQALEWDICAHDQPVDLQARLAAQGFALEESGAILMLAPAAAPADLLAPVTADIRRVTHPDQLPALVAIMEQVWGSDFAWMYAQYGRDLALPGYLSMYLAYVAGQPAAAAWTYYYAQAPGGAADHPFAGLWGGSTLPAYRGRGLYTALLAIRVQEARARGLPYVMVDAVPASAKILRRFGFTEITQTHAMLYQP
jgi:GNAT superfamily N-acetyltransferase